MRAKLEYQGVGFSMHGGEDIHSEVVKKRKEESKLTYFWFVCTGNEEKKTNTPI